MTDWVDLHPGGAVHIKQWYDEKDSALLMYPSQLEKRPHGMTLWNNNVDKFRYLGRYGDDLKMNDLPTYMQSLSVKDLFKSPNNISKSKRNKTKGSESYNKISW